MNITGEKVILRPADLPDRTLLQELLQDPEIVKVTGGYQSAGSGAGWRSRALPFLAPDPPGSLRRVIADREAPETGIGIVMLTHMDPEQGTAEIYIKLAGFARGRGYGRDAVCTMVSCALGEPGLKQICASILEDNIISRRLFEACGFRLEKVHRGSADRDGCCRVVYSYVITDRDMQGKSSD